MNKHERHENLARSFWDYSLDLYDKDGVADDLILLQDECGLDVNVILLICWLASKGMLGIKKAQTDFMFRAAATWQQGVIAPLRGVRRDVGNNEAKEVQAVYKSLKNSELEAEKAAQFSMISCLAQLDFEMDTGKAMEICENLLDRYFQFLDFSFTDKRHQAALDRVLVRAY